MITLIKNKYLPGLMLVLIFLKYTVPVNAQTVCTGDSVLLNAQNYVAGNVQWQRSPDNVIWYDLAGATSLSCTIYPTETYYYRLLITDSNCLPPYATPATLVPVIAQPTQANAGADQLNQQGTSLNLSANTPLTGTGVWSVVFGSGGVFGNSSQANSLFTGVPGVLYTLKWTIYNACDTTYDDVNISFSNSFNCGDSILDSRDSQKYPTVLIGAQCWMKRNLNYGQMINSSGAQTNNSTPEKYCYDNLTGNCDTYGGMYQWDELMQYSTTESVQGLCPSGWHIPSDSEWKTLEIALGMSQAEADLANIWRGTGIGTSLKVGGASGFEALIAGGLWGPGGPFLYINSMTYFWTSTESGSNAWRRCLSATADNVGRWNTFPKTYGFSVRCVKN